MGRSGEAVSEQKALEVARQDEIVIEEPVAPLGRLLRTTQSCNSADGRRNTRIGFPSGLDGTGEA